jgi:hypothetical protein
MLSFHQRKSDCSEMFCFAVLEAASRRTARSAVALSGGYFVTFL